MVYPLSTVILLIIAVITWKPAGYWQNSITLFEHTLEVTGPNCAAHNILGVAFDKQGRTAEAIEHLKALQMKPDFENALNNLGAAFNQQDKTEEAIKYCLKALSLNPGNTKVHFNLGVALAPQDNTAGAIKHYSKAFLIKPDFEEAH